MENEKQHLIAFIIGCLKNSITPLRNVTNYNEDVQSLQLVPHILLSDLEPRMSEIVLCAFLI